MTLKEAIEQVIELLNKGWTQGAYARDSRDNPLSSCDPLACQWCLVGAWNKITDNIDRSNRIKLQNEFAIKARPMVGPIILFNNHLVRYNDSHTKEHIISLLKVVADDA